MTDDIDDAATQERHARMEADQITIARYRAALERITVYGGGIAREIAWEALK